MGVYNPIVGLMTIPTTQGTNESLDVMAHIRATFWTWQIPGPE